MPYFPVAEVFSSPSLRFSWTPSLQPLPLRPVQLQSPQAGLKESLAKLLVEYEAAHPSESAVVARFADFVASGEELQGKSNLARHITASTWIVNPARDKALMTHHRKLKKWLQLGGHTDEGEEWLAGAVREAEEESGLPGAALAVVSPALFDLDVHEIPANASTGPHLHYDLRFLLEVDDALPLVVSEESLNLAWVPFAALTDAEESIVRMTRKTPPAKQK